MAEQKLTIQEIQAQLAAPFITKIAGREYPAVKWLPKDTKSAQDKIMCVPFIDRQLVINRLNSVMGIGGWQFEVQREADGSKTGTLSLLLDGSWISKSDTGTPSKHDAEKGATSDALKRAATQFGIGTYIYSIGNKWINSKPRSNKPAPVDNNGKFLYGDQVSAFLNGMSTEQGVLVQLLTLQPDLWKREEIKKLWNEFKIK